MRSSAEQASFEAKREFELALLISEHDGVDLVEAMTRMKIAERRAARRVPFHQSTPAHCATSAADQPNDKAANKKRAKRDRKKAAQHDPAPYASSADAADALPTPPEENEAQQLAATDCQDTVLLIPPAPKQRQPPPPAGDAIDALIRSAEQSAPKRQHSPAQTAATNTITTNKCSPSTAPPPAKRALALPDPPPSPPSSPPSSPSPPLLHQPPPFLPRQLRFPPPKTRPRLYVCHVCGTVEVHPPSCSHHTYSISPSDPQYPNALLLSTALDIASYHD
jgi:hypothetical protein